VVTGPVSSGAEEAMGFGNGSHGWFNKIKGHLCMARAERVCKGLSVMLNDGGVLGAGEVMLEKIGFCFNVVLYALV